MAHVVADRFSSTAAHRLLVSDNEGAETPDGDGPRSLVTRPDPPPDEEPDLPGDGLGRTSFREDAPEAFDDPDPRRRDELPFRRRASRGHPTLLLDRTCANDPK